MPVIIVETVEPMSGGLKITGTTFYEEDDQESEVLDSSIPEGESDEEDLLILNETELSPEEQISSLEDLTTKRVVDYIPYKNISRFYFEDTGSVTIDFQNGTIQYYKGITGELFVKMLNAFDRHLANAIAKD